MTTPVEAAILGMEIGSQDTSPYKPGDTLKLAQLIYGEVGNQPDHVKAMVGSTVMNRKDSGRTIEFGEDIEGVINSKRSPYYAPLNNSPQFQQAYTGKFPDKISENAFKKSLQIANGLMRGTIKRHEAMFFLTGIEVSGQKRRKKGGMDFKLLRETGKVGKYHTYSY